MKKIRSQVTVALVCALLGFMLTHQFLLLSAEDRKLQSNKINSTEITAEIDQLKKQKSEIEKKNNEMVSQLKNYESAATNQDELSKEIKKQLDDSRILLGISDVQGAGVVIYLTPPTATFSGTAPDAYISHEELVYIINELNFAGAEAVSINDKRITAQSGIRSSSDNSYILVNEEKVLPKERITIRAIGDKTKLESALNFPQALDYKNLSSYKIVIEKQDSIKIPKYNKVYRSQYVKPVNK